MTYDSGAVVTALPLAVVEGKAVSEGEPFVGAGGHQIRNFGKMKVVTSDENNQSRKLCASVADVHKPLVSAGELSKNQDSFLMEDGGFLIPRGSEIGKQMRIKLQELIIQYGDKELVKLYKEGGLYNFYVQMKEINAVESSSSGSAAGPSQSSFPRQAQERP